MRSRPIASFILLIVSPFVLLACASSLKRAEKPQPLVVFLTDFGEQDHYVGAMKGATLSANPSVRIDEISNQISKFDIAEGAYTLQQAAREYPDGTIFVAVVDPGVGTQRKAIAVRTTNRKVFIGPDNGLLSLAVRDGGMQETREITNTELMRPGKISNTFHGRDIFGPVAGHLAAGVHFEDVGPKMSSIIELSEPEAILDNGKIIGRILHADGYGNLISNIPISMVEEIGVSVGSFAILTVKESELKAQYVRTYGEVDIGKPLLLNNKGFVEAAINNASLKETIGAQSGEKLIIRPVSGGQMAK